jgi:vesicle transport through interaction with t-SNAREs protein 1
VSILQDLHRQRETISSAREHVHGADDNIGRSRRILAAMGRNVFARMFMPSSGTDDARAPNPPPPR